MAGTPKADPRANPAARPPPVRPPERTRGGAEQNLGIRPGPPRSAHGDPARDRSPPDRTGEVRRLPRALGIQREVGRWRLRVRRVPDSDPMPRGGTGILGDPLVIGLMQICRLWT